MILFSLIAYLVVLFLYSKWATGRSNSNESFFRGNRKSPWYMVAFGMIGASVSGITFVSVPGMVLHSDMTYLQTCIGFIFGYIAVAFILLPLYYRLNLTTIYTYLRDRLGVRSYKTGAAFFLLSKMTGAAARFYVVCFMLQSFLLGEMGVPFVVTVTVMVALIWLYTRNGGIKTLVWTDSLQTICMLSALFLIIYNTSSELNMGVGEAFSAVWSNEHSRIFVWDDFVSPRNFFKQFLSGIFIVIVMTGLDQDMMQKNLTCKSLKDAQKDMCTYGLAFLPVNFIFLALGVMLMLLCSKTGLALPEQGDKLLPMFAASGRLGTAVLCFFTIGLMAASFSSADSALTAMTTSYCVDIREKADDEKLRKRVHIAMSVVFIVCIVFFNAMNSTSLIDAIYTLCSYTYGPLLGLFAFGMISKKHINDAATPYIAVASPLICFALDYYTSNFCSYRFGYELLMLNGALTFTMLWLNSKKESHPQLP